MKKFRDKYIEEIGSKPKYIKIFLYTKDSEESFERIATRGVDVSDIKDIKSKCSHESFEGFKKILEEYDRDENSYKVVSDDKIFNSINKILKHYL